MALPNVAVAEELGRGRPLPRVEADHERESAVSWGAIVAGAAAAAALSLILLMLGTGLGLSSVSPWTHDGVSATTFGVSTILWVIFTQLVASGMGGYLAGRLRTKWVAVHTDEVYFRDTAHGFLAWAVASLATAALLTSAIGSIVSGGLQAGASVAGGLATAATAVGAASAGSEVAKSDSDGGPMGYVDSLFRKEVNASAGAEGGAPDQVATASRDAADQARKASAYAALWLFISLLTGAFVASLAATFGGRRRDL
jgi:hypothetical protein